MIDGTKFIAAAVNFQGDPWDILAKGSPVESALPFGCVLTHAQTLAIVLPSVLSVKKTQKSDKLLQYAERVWGLTKGNDAERIDAAIETTRAFFERMQVKAHLSDYGITKESIPKLVAQLEQHGMVKLGEKKDVTPEVSKRILELSL